MAVGEEESLQHASVCDIGSNTIDFIYKLNEAKSNEDIGAIVVLEHSMDLLQRAGINNQVKVKVDYEYKNI